ncbi:MAG: 4Fe-4S binding protein [Dehalococcoidales bacterium]|nr:4Fe-4S binding protein [Dehalococcoidales bacterium]
MIYIGVLIAIGLASGLSIYLAHIRIPQKVKGLEKAEELKSILPGINCGACGYPSCFGYARALSQNSDLVTKTPCAFVLQDPEGLGRLEKALGVSLDAAGMSKKALIHCTGNSETVLNYSGIETCKAATQLLSGYKKCPFACLGLGDCLKVCPADAISINPEKGVAVIDPRLCTGCGLCVIECSQNLIELVPAETRITFLCNYKPLRNIPGRERCDYACTHCRKCYKACEDEAIVWNKEKAVPEFIQEKCTLCGKCIDVCEQHTLADFTKWDKAPEPERVIIRAAEGSGGCHADIP